MYDIYNTHQRERRRASTLRIRREKENLLLAVDRLSYYIYMQRNETGE